MEVSLISQKDWPEWDRFVKGRPNSSLYHTLEWKNILETSFGYKAKLLAVRSNTEIIDILPLYLISLLGIRKKLVCIPLSGSYSAFLSEDSTAHSLLIEAAVDLAVREGVQYIEIRNNIPHDILVHHNFIEHRPFYFPQIEIHNADANKRLMTHGHRESIAKFQKKGAHIEVGCKKDDLKKFYAILEDMYREFGTPIFSYSYLENMWNILKPQENIALYVIKHNEKIIGGGCMLLYRDQMIYKYGAYIMASRSLCPTHGLVWFGITECVRRGLQVFDLGATSAGDKGLLQFKKNFGAAENPAYFYYFPVKGKPPEMETYLDSFQLIKRVWKLLPKPLLRFIGPQFYKWIC